MLCSSNFAQGLLVVAIAAPSTPQAASEAKLAESVARSTSEPFAVRRRWAWSPWDSELVIAGAICNVGDLDDDGWGDVALAETTGFLNGRLLVLSGRDGSSLCDETRPLPEIDGMKGEFGGSIALVDDLDGDGRLDFAVGECGADPLGRGGPYGAWVFGGKPLMEISHWRRRTEGFGRVVARLGDVDRDGTAEIAVLCDPYGGPYIEALALGADTPVWRLPLANFNRLHSGAMESVADVDGDGIRELAVAVNGSTRDTQSLLLLRGRDGELLWTLTDLCGEYGPRETKFVDAGDLDADGSGDLWLCSGSTGSSGWKLSALSGADGRELFALCGGAEDPCPSSMCTTPDLDGDGLRDLALARTEVDLQERSFVQILAGSDLRELLEFECGVSFLVCASEAPNGCSITVSDGDSDARSYEIGSASRFADDDAAPAAKFDYEFTTSWTASAAPEQSFGPALALLDDENGDGEREYALSVRASADRRSVWIGSSRDGRWIRELNAVPDPSTGTTSLFGLSLDAVPDVDGDGFADVVVTDRARDATSRSPANRIHAFSGRSGERLWSWGEAEPSNERWEVRGSEDLDGDGAGDVLAHRVGASKFSCFSGRTGRLRYTSFALPWLTPVPLGDVDGDGAEDVLLDPSNFADIAVVSGLTGARVWASRNRYEGTKYRGIGARVADRDGDGRDDVWLAEGCETLVNCERWSLALISSANGERLARHALDDAIGAPPEIANLGDVDGDGIDDLLIRHPLELHGPRGELCVVSGADGRRLARRDVEQHAAFAADPRTQRVLLAEPKVVTSFVLRSTQSQR